MALGPKAMGEAIAVNLKTKTGKTLEEWLALLDTQGVKNESQATQWLKEQGLGHFQAQLVISKRNGESLYENPEQLISDLFQGRGDQRDVYNRIIDVLREKMKVTINPCKGYIPLYSEKNKIFASFKPTNKGLYVGLIGSGYANAIKHQKSLGGAERMREGMYIHSVDEAVGAIERSYDNTMKGE